MKALFLFLDIVQLSCGSHLATGTLVKTPRGPELWTVQHFIESCRSEGSFTVHGAKGELGRMRIDLKRLRKFIYRAPLQKLPELTTDSKSFEGQLQCRMLSRRIIADDRQRREEAARLRGILQKAEALRQQPATAPAALLFLDRALEHGYSSWMESDLRHAFLQDLPAPGGLQASLINQPGRSKSRLWSDDIYAVASSVQELRETAEGYTADCDGWYGSSGGALIDTNKQVLGLIEGSQDQLASVFNGIAAVGRLRIHKIGELP
jgi:hypothetical protein